MSSKSILIVLSYTVSKFARFFDTQCMYTEHLQIDNEFITV